MLVTLQQVFTVMVTNAMISTNSLDLAQHKHSDIVYNNVSELWACCSSPSTDRDCKNPSNETFQATPPDELKRISTSLPSISPSTNSATTVTVSNITGLPSTTNQSTERSDRSLGSGAKAGIVIGAVVVGLLILAGIVLLVRRSKRRKRVLHGPDQAADQSVHIFTSGEAELETSEEAELETGNNRAELH